eukprot:TRINITY_DN974_c2_g1_i1.p1 TRINITY_DN974_c2_g1~~TRINITY_DN974_c2_g1_i1.p1  ORF type:complete len:380 (+),score=67.97 TRINITY_DN974_c2_g1_i1:50-1189(+)
MEVTVKDVDSGRSCVVDVSDSDTVLELKARALKEMFADSSKICQEAIPAARIAGCEEDLDDAQRVSDTHLEGGGVVELLSRWVEVKEQTHAVGDIESNMQHISLTKCGRLCAASNTGGKILVFETSTSDVVAELTHGNQEVWGNAFSVCGTWLATCSDITICVWQTATWELAWDVQVSTAPAWSMIWTQCGSLISGDAKDLSVWAFAGEGKPSATLLTGHTEAVYGLAVSDTTIYSGSRDHTIRVWDLADARHTNTLDSQDSAVNHLVLTSDNSRLVSCFDRYVKVWCTATLTCTCTVEVNQTVYLLAVSQPGDVVAALGDTRTVLVRLSTGECVGQLPSQAEGLALSPCGRWVFTPDGQAVVVSAVHSAGPYVDEDES